MMAWFADLRIEIKCALAPALAIVGLIGVAVAAILVFARLTGDFRSLNETSFARFTTATEFERAVLRVNAELYAIGSLAANSQESARVATRIAAVLTRIEDLAQTGTSVAALADGDEGRQAILGALAAYGKGARDMLDMTQVDSGMALLLMGSVQDTFTTLEKLLGNLIEAADSGRKETYRDALASIVAARAGLLAGTILAVLGAIVATLLASRAISRPMLTLTATMTRMADGASDVAITGQQTRDELGAMARALEVFKEHAIERARLRREHEAEREGRLAHARSVETGARQFESEVAAVLATFSAAGGELDEAARSMSMRAAKTSECSASMVAVAGQTSADVEAVTAAAGELAASIAQTGDRVVRSSTIARDAVAQARQTNEAVGALAVAARKIGEVVALIQSIAGQTNLLALNATIEAARAGEHGKGFAVVASEVKLLAGQTGRATEEISGQIRAIQSATDAAVEAIRAIGATIAEIDEISGLIASAVEQQGQATRAIGDSVQHASEGTRQMSANMTEMSQAADEVGAAVTHVLHSSGQLAGESAALQARVEAFLATVSAA